MLLRAQALSLAQVSSLGLDLAAMRLFVRCRKSGRGNPDHARIGGFGLG
jgi:hypothetical protein